MVAQKHQHNANISGHFAHDMKIFKKTCSFKLMLHKIYDGLTPILVTEIER
jgi:hypothetical protein